MKNAVNQAMYVEMAGYIADATGVMSLIDESIHGERGLWCAVIEQAICDYREFKDSKTERGKAIFESARRFLFHKNYRVNRKGREGEVNYTLDDIVSDLRLDHRNMNPEYIRRKLKDGLHDRGRKCKTGNKKH